jgi:uncharacterized membrane protein
MCLAVKGYLVLDADLENLQAILLESYFQILSTLTLMTFLMTLHMYQINASLERERERDREKERKKERKKDRKKEMQKARGG